MKNNMLLIALLLTSQATLVAMDQSKQPSELSSSSSKGKQRAMPDIVRTPLKMPNQETLQQRFTNMGFGTFIKITAIVEQVANKELNPLQIDDIVCDNIIAYARHVSSTEYSKNLEYSEKLKQILLDRILHHKLRFKMILLQDHPKVCKKLGYNEQTSSEATQEHDLTKK